MLVISPWCDLVLLYYMILLLYMTLIHDFIIIYEFITCFSYHIWLYYMILLLYMTLLHDFIIYSFIPWFHYHIWIYMFIFSYITSTFSYLHTMLSHFLLLYKIIKFAFIISLCKLYNGLSHHCIFSSAYIFKNYLKFAYFCMLCNY